MSVASTRSQRDAGLPRQCLDIDRVMQASFGQDPTDRDPRQCHAIHRLVDFGQGHCAGTWSRSRFSIEQYRRISL